MSGAGAGAGPDGRCDSCDGDHHGGVTLQRPCLVTCLLFFSFFSDVDVGFLSIIVFLSLFSHEAGRPGAGLG